MEEEFNIKINKQKMKILFTVEIELIGHELNWKIDYRSGKVF